MTTQQDNQQQTQFWNGPGGDAWVAAQARMDQLLAGFSAAALHHAEVDRGDIVLDVGCGCGDTTVALARSASRALGLDISAPMLARARQRAGEMGLDNVAFVEADAALHVFDERFDLVFSRFGVMFFADPRAAFSNLRGALEFGGRVSFICWQSPRNNPWMAIPGAAARPFLPAPAEASNPRAPGPFAFAEQDYVHGILQEAGFHEVSIEPVQGDMNLGGSVDQAIDFLLRTGPMSRALAELDEDTRGRALNAVREALAPHGDARGVILPGACWLVQGRNP